MHRREPNHIKINNSSTKQTQIINKKRKNMVSEHLPLVKKKVKSFLKVFWVKVIRVNVCYTSMTPDKKTKYKHIYTNGSGSYKLLYWTHRFGIVRMPSIYHTIVEVRVRTFTGCTSLQIQVPLKCVRVGFN